MRGERAGQGPSREREREERERTENPKGGIDEVKSRGEEKRGRIESRRNHLLTGREMNENMYFLHRMGKKKR